MVVRWCAQSFSCQTQLLCWLLVLCCRWGCDNEDSSVLNLFIVSFCFWLIVAPFFSLLMRRGRDWIGGV